jgi:peroxiredoxin (alkyl hydroperoxide reductase subunit C)
MSSESRIPLIGEKAPFFQAETTQGPITFPDDYKGKWVVFFSHPADFTPVCTTEFMTFASMQPEFEKLNCKLIGLSSTALTATSHGCGRSRRRSSTST